MLESRIELCLFGPFKLSQNQPHHTHEVGVFRPNPTFGPIQSSPLSGHLSPCLKRLLSIVLKQRHSLTRRSSPALVLVERSSDLHDVKLFQAFPPP